MLTFIRYIAIHLIFKIALLDCVRLYNEDFVKLRFCPGGGGTSLLEANGMCRWMGSHFHD